MAHACYGRCAVFLVAALVLDAAGLALVLAGAVGQPALNGRSFEDFLVLSGALLLFLSLLCWLFWYSGNLRGVPAEELPRGAPSTASPSQSRSRASLLRLAAKLSERLSQRRRPAPAPFLPPDFGPPAKSTRTAAAVSVRVAGPLELSRLRQAVQPEQGMTTREERLV
ncbi:transmembrane protein 238-like [Rhineura floridana]|uniref:transmembrane protein 238-like n=1 Tax=Rhineura floridana TaxID=261503 RepID=UPI002AC867CE|nr:transmembrane protein 238-like [Rhineura floridana]